MADIFEETAEQEMVHAKTCSALSKVEKLLARRDSGDATDGEWRWRTMNGR